MNLLINKLATLPRGKAWRSRLNYFEKDIRRLRDGGESYRAIACWLVERGLTISASAVHGYVRARARRGQGQYVLPEPAPPSGPATPTDNYASKGLSVVPPSLADENAPHVVSKAKFIFVPKSQPKSPFCDADLQINDPLA